MAGHTHNGSAMQQHLDALNWPVLGISAALWPFLSELWEHVPGPTAVYMVVSAAFMIFQMCDKMGLLDGRKRRKLELPEKPDAK